MAHPVRAWRRFASGSWPRAQHVQPRAHGRRVGQCVARRGGAPRAHHHADPANRFDVPQGILVGEVVAQHPWTATTERRGPHQRGERAALVDARRFQFDHVVAALQRVASRGFVGQLRGDAFGCRARLGCVPVVQGERTALVLQHDPAGGFDQAHRMGVQPGVGLVVAGRFLAAVRQPQLGAVQSGRGMAVPVEQRIELRQRAPAQQRDRAVEALAQPRQVVMQARIDFDVVGMRREIQQRAIDVEEQRPPGIGADLGRRGQHPGNVIAGGGHGLPGGGCDGSLCRNRRERLFHAPMQPVRRECWLPCVMPIRPSVARMGGPPPAGAVCCLDAYVLMRSRHDVMANRHDPRKLAEMFGCQTTAQAAVCSERVARILGTARRSRGWTHPTERDMALNGLFRQEVLQTRSAQWLGATRLATPVSHQVWGVAAAAMSVAILLWLFLGHYTRREHVVGSLVPRAGLLNVTARVAGTITQLNVVEGAHVRAGAPLITISSDQSSVAMGDTSAAINAQLLKQQAKIKSTIVDARRMADEQTADLHMQQRMLHTQMEKIDAQLAIENDEASKLSHLLERFQTLVDKGYVSALQIQQQREQVSGTKAEIKGLERDRSQVKQQLVSVGDKLVELPLTTSAKLNDLQQQMAQNKQALIDNAKGWASVLRAPHNGVVSDVLIHPGQAVVPGQTLVTIMPKDSLLQAQLLVPSSAIGFVHNGTSVVLHYHAFPYQKFGVQHGTVINVSRAALTPAEVSALVGQAPPPESLYRVKVKLDKQTIDAYGKPRTLLPGMSLDADLLLDRRRMIQWIFEPLYGITERGGKA